MIELIEKHIEMINIQKELIDKINKAASLIAQRSRNGSGDYIVASPAVADKFEQINIELDALNTNNERAKKLKKILDEPE
jgi:hypothetical protein